MPSTYSSSLRLELQASGENANTWGTKTNNNLNLIEQAIAGYSKITLASASATYTLPIADASASEGRNAFIEFAGTVASAISVIVPEVEKGYWVRNSATGSTLTVRTSAGTGVTLPTNEWVFLISDGVSVYSTLPTSLTNYARLNASQTFTGANTFTSAVTVSGPAAFASLVDIKGPTSLASTLVVGGSATFSSWVDILGLDVGAGANIDGFVNLTGNGIVGNAALSVTGGVRFNLDNGDLVGFQVSGQAFFSSATFSQAVTVAGTFTVSGVATLASVVNIKGPTSLASTLVTNATATFNSNVSVSGSFTVSGATTLASAVDIKGADSAAATLRVNVVATFNSNVSVSGSVFVSGTSYVGALNSKYDIVVSIAGGAVSRLSDISLTLNESNLSGAVESKIFFFTSGASPDSTIVQYPDFFGSKFEIYNQTGPISIESVKSDITLSVSATSKISFSAGGNGVDVSTSAFHMSIPARFVRRATAPTAPVGGEVYFDTSANMLRCYNGTIWKDLF
jgi:hypothetical protein